MEGFKSSNVIIGQADNIGKKMSSNKAKESSKNKTYIVDGRKISALSRQDALKKAKKTKRTTNAAGQRMGQRKAGGIIKAKNGTLTDKAYEKAKAREEGGRVSVTDVELALKSIGETSASVSPTLLKKAKKLAKEIGGRFSKKDMDMALKSLSRQRTYENSVGKKKKPNLSQRKAGGVIKAGKGKIIGKMFKEVKDYAKKPKQPDAIDRIIKKYPKTAAVSAVAVMSPAAFKIKKEKKDIGKDKKRKEKKNVSQADIIGKGSKKGRMAGGMMKKYTKGGMNKYNKGSMLGDLNKDGVMSGYEQKRQDAITTAMGNKKMGGGMAKKKMMGGGMMQYSKGTGKKGVTVQARGCGLARKKPTKMS
tara:strand:+ start:1 stop:1086 length:1086 start_codon:yes stop_codon:yes gene_type:complete